MSLGPTNNISRQSSVSQTRAVETAAPAAPTTAPAEVAAEAEAQRVAPDADIQAGARLASRGAEEAVRARLQTEAPAAPASTDAPRRGLGLEGQEFAGKRSASGRRTAENTAAPAPGAPSVQMASLPADGGLGTSSAAAPSAENAPFEAGKRSTKGRRVGEAEVQERPMLANTPGAPDAEPILLAGKRTASGTRVGDASDEIKKLDPNAVDIGMA